MTGDDSGDDPGYDQPRVPAQLRDRINELFVEYRGYEPATFQESLSLVADLAAARVEAEREGAAAALDDASGDAGSADAGGSASGTPEATASGPPGADSGADRPGADATAGDGLASPTDADVRPGEDVTEVSTDVVDDAGEETFAELDGDDGANADGPAAAADGPAGDGPTGDGSIPESLRADPESNCAYCGEVHPVSVLQTTIPEGRDSIALVCPSCAD